MPLREDDPEFSSAYSAARKLILPPNCLVLCAQSPFRINRPRQLADHGLGGAGNSKTLHGTSPGSRERPDTADGLPKLNRLTCAAIDWILSGACG